MISGILTNSTSNVEASPFGGTPVSIQLPTVVIGHQILSFSHPYITLLIEYNRALPSKTSSRLEATDSRGGDDVI
jgi:hypothetical protein